MKPTVGRIVHYQSFGTPNGEHHSLARAAVITSASPWPTSEHCIGVATDAYYQDETNYCVSLCILNPTGQFFNTDVRYSSEPKAGCWNWPPKS
jgi:hypothetical protein